MNLDDIIQALYKEIHAAAQRARAADANEDYPQACAERGYEAGIGKAIQMLKYLDT